MAKSTTSETSALAAILQFQSFNIVALCRGMINLFNNNLNFKIIFKLIIKIIDKFIFEEISLINYQKLKRKILIVYIKISIL